MNPLRSFWGFVSGRAFVRHSSPQRRYVGEFTWHLLLFGFVAALSFVLYLLLHH
jgi:hypothetical protein